MNPDIDYRDHVFTISATDVAGANVTAQEVRATLDGSGTAAEMYLYLRDSSGTNLASATGSGADKTLVLTGPLPPGEYTLRVRLFVGADASYTADVEVDYWSVV